MDPKAWILANCRFTKDLTNDVRSAIMDPMRDVMRAYRQVLDSQGEQRRDAYRALVRTAMRRQAKRIFFRAREASLKQKKIVVTAAQAPEERAEPKYVQLQDVAAAVGSLGDMSYALIGGLALAVHGYVRNTQDVDVMINPQDFGAAKQRLEDYAASLGQEVVWEPLTDSGAVSVSGVTALVGGVQLDLVTYDEPWVGEALANAVDTPYGKTLSKPYLMLVKLVSGRASDISDVGQLEKEMDPAEVQAAEALVQQHAPLRMEELNEARLFRDINEGNLSEERYMELFGEEEDPV